MHNKDIEDIEFSIFDTETTGLDPRSGDRIVEIAAVRLKGKDKLGEFHSLVNPGRPISEGAYQVNKITAEMLQGAPPIGEVIPGFLEFIKGSCLCSYNAMFDLEFLESELKLAGLDFPEDVLVIDILRMSRKILPRLERYALWFVAEKLAIDFKQEHRALSDVELTLSVFLKLKDLLFDKGIRDLNSFSHLFAVSGRLINDIAEGKLAQIQEAIDLGVKLRIKYLSSSGDITERDVSAEKVICERDVYYLVGHCFLRNDERSFRIDSILDMEILR